MYESYVETQSSLLLYIRACLNCRRFHCADCAHWDITIVRLVRIAN